ncbi:MAG: hypothetical protein ACTSU2_16000 [Promethearchaeota archaeon]
MIDVGRFIQVYIVQLGMGIYYMILGIIILKRARNKDYKIMNYLIDSFYFSLFIGIILNVIYASLEINPYVKILHIATLGFMLFSNIFLLIFNLVILYSEKIFNRKKQMLVLFIFLVAILSMIVFSYKDISIDETTSWKPVWHITAYIGGLIFITSNLIPNLYSSMKVYKAFKDVKKKRKWLAYVIGIIIFYCEEYLLVTNNFLNIDSLRMYVALISLIISIINAYLIYFGLAKRLS